MSEKLRILDDKITEMEIFQERIFWLADAINQDFFNINAKEESHILYNFKNAGIGFDILFDYVIRSGEELGEIREMLRERSRGAISKNTCCPSGNGAPTPEPDGSRSSE